jgi:uncharacterized protein
MRISLSLSSGLALLCLACTFALALDFPVLTGRVVDQADVMSQESRAGITAKSQALEQQSGIQLVVATVKSLEGGDIETYANELFRTWKLGQEQKNNGVLMLVAPNEHKVRIEVGYGFEGTLTDALSSVIISSAIIPRFKSGDFSGGIDRGVDGIISVLNGNTADWQPQSLLRTDDPGALNTLFPILGFFAVALILWLIIAGISRLVSGPSGHYVKRSGKKVFVRDRSSSWSSSSSSSSSSDSGSSSSSSSDSDFSGGGGSSGGGGASGSW